MQGAEAPEMRGAGSPQGLVAGRRGGGGWGRGGIWTRRAPPAGRGVLGGLGWGADGEPAGVVLSPWPPGGELQADGEAHR